MALLWEVDTIGISPLADAQYPTYTATWRYIFPHTSISADGDVHTDMAVDSVGSGSTGNNAGASPIVTEVINATTPQLNHLRAFSAGQATFRGIFRFYTEHAGERHFELHPVTELDTWNGTAFVQDTDYRANIISDPNGTTHSDATLTSVINGSQTLTATIASDNTRVDFVFPSPSVNYGQFAGVALSGVASDATSSYFLFRPNLFPSATLRCRLVANSAAANAAPGLTVNQTVTVNALTRADMGYVSDRIAALTAGQSATFPRQVELIVLGLPGFTAPLQVLRAVSSKVHGGAGSFDTDLPLSGTAGIECRAGGLNGNHTIVVSLTNNIVSGNASVVSGTGTIAGSPVFSGNTMTINLTGVANAQNVVLAIRNVTDTFGQVLPDMPVSVSFLEGDTNGNGAVNATDVGMTKAQSGQAVSGANFRTDVNANGAINATDIGQVKAQSGNFLP